MVNGVQLVRRLRQATHPSFRKTTLGVGNGVRMLCVCTHVVYTSGPPEVRYKQLSFDTRSTHHIVTESGETGQLDGKLVGETTANPHMSRRQWYLGYLGYLCAAGRC